jgi:hypothetical protein
MQFGFDEPAAKPAPKPEARPAAGSGSVSSFAAPDAAPAKKTETAAPSEPAAGSISPEDFLNDPLIKSAVEQFKLKIATPS